MTELLFKVSSHGTSFATRERAQLLWRQILADLSDKHRALNLDFQGVRVISYSFADQMMTELARVMGEEKLLEVKLTNCGAETIDVLTDVINRRSRLNSATARPKLSSHSIAFIASAA